MGGVTLIMTPELLETGDYTGDEEFVIGEYDGNETLILKSDIDFMTA